jgi:hypothetical protein
MIKERLQFKWQLRFGFAQRKIRPPEECRDDVSEVEGLVQAKVLLNKKATLTVTFLNFLSHP